MAKKADNKPAAPERVTFTSGAADRIAKVVRAVEGGDRDCGPLTFGARIGGVSGKTFRVGTFTGAWSINDTKTVTFKNQTATPNTVAAVNLFFPFSAATNATTDCAIAKDGTAWYLIDVPFETATAVFAGSTTTGIVVSSTQSTSRVTDVTLSATLNTSNCTISIGKTLVTASTIFVTGTATGVFVQSTFTSTFLRFKV
jgi:hypothetical protein